LILFILEKNQIIETLSFIRRVFCAMNMGGAKKVTTATKDKSAGTKETKKGKKDKGEGGPKKAEITVMVNEQQAMKILQSSKVITVHDMARQLGVKVSAANKFLKNSVQNGSVKVVGGFSGHFLYQSKSS
jgi:small subunit ribosomal protein S25e